jgi:hypothetical protein
MGHQRCPDSESGRGHPEVVLIKWEAAALPGHFHAGIVITSARRDWLACQRCEKSLGFHLEIGTALSRSQSFKTKQNLATGDSTHDDSIIGSNGR